MKRLRMVLAAVPFSCWCAMAWARASNGWHSLCSASAHGPTARIRPASTGSAADRCARMCWLTVSSGGLKTAGARLLLAGGAIVSGALPLDQRAHRCAAAPAGPAAALIDVQPLAEITGRTVGAEIIAQRRAARADGLGEDRAHRTHQPRGIRARQRARLPARADTPPEQRLARVDVAHADHQAAVHEQLLDGDPPATGDAPQVIRIEGGGERLGPEVRQQWMRARIAARIEEAAEAARIVEAQRQPGIEHQVEMVVGEARGTGGHGAQIARHAQMHEQRAGLESQQQVLGAPSGAQDTLPGDLVRQLGGHLPAQARLVFFLSDAPPTQIYTLPYTTRR